VATAGSCFAQHVGRRLKAGGFALLDVEPPPAGLNADHHAKFGYSIYSARYGNVYTTRQLLQLAQSAFGEFEPADYVWQKKGRYYDALRPGVEPDGLASPDEVVAHRRVHLKRVRELLLKMDVFVFTLGLTESWEHTETGTSYPTVPGSVAGQFDDSRHRFRNLGFNDVLIDFLEFRRLLDRVRHGAPCRFLLTVSPVPLAATASGNHVLQATMLSKAVLRAAAGELAAGFPDIDYFPSFEIITNPWSQDDFYETNRRDVTADGVALAMKTFMSAHVGAAAQEATPKQSDKSLRAAPAAQVEDDTVAACEEQLLEHFASTQP
jgi:hypothetical protein